jgi:hypothetical protein
MFKNNKYKNHQPRLCFEMYEKLNTDDIYKKHNNEPLYKFKVDEKYEFICSKSGEIYRKMKTGYWKKIENKKNHVKGYNMIMINKKQYSRARLVLYASNLIKIDEKNIINYINGNKLDCNIDNLIIR